MVKKNAGVGPDRLTPLMWAAAKGNFELVTLLLDNKVRVHGTDKYKRSALTLAIRNGHTRVASLLL
jgi:ankyrin repeat protein